jgi:hypothetical protein
MKIKWISSLAIGAFLFLVSSLSAQQFDLSRSQRINLQKFIAEQGSTTLPFNFWTAHPPDAADPAMVIIWVAAAGQTPDDANGVDVHLMATDPEGLACLKKLRRGAVGKIIFTPEGHALIDEATLSVTLFQEP